VIQEPIDLAPVIETSRAQIAKLREQREKLESVYNEAHTSFGFAPFVTLILASVNSCDEQIRNWERMLRLMEEK